MLRSLFLVSRLGPDADILEAARQAGVEHVVLVSSITVQTHPHLGPAAENLAVEQLLKASGMAWTVLRPTQFASNTLMWAASTVATRPSARRTRRPCCRRSTPRTSRRWPGWH